MISWLSWLDLSPKSTYNEYTIAYEEIRDKEEIIDDAVEERVSLKGRIVELEDEIKEYDNGRITLKERIVELEEEIKGYREGEDSFTKDQRKADAEGLL